MARPPVRSRRVHVVVLTLLGLLSSSPAIAQGEVSAPRLARWVDADLPPEVSLGARGLRVGLHLLVTPTGEVGEVQVVEPLGAVIDRAVESAARRLRFVPARRGGRPVAARIAYAYEVGGDPLLRASRPWEEADAHRTLEPALASRGGGSAKATSPAEATSPAGTLLGARSPAATSLAGGSPADPPLEVPRAEPEEEEIVVTGARMGERAADAVVATDVIRRRQLEENGWRTVAEALEEQPGVQVVRSFRGAELWLRGLGPRYTLVLVDGNRVPGRSGGAIDLERYASQGIERVEIVRGPSSALYGSDAIGGVVNIIPREPKGELEADAQARISSNSHDGSARISGHPLAGLGVELEGGRLHTDAIPGQEGPATSASARTQNFVGGAVTWGEPRRNQLRLESDYVRTELVGVDAGAAGAVFDRTQLQELAQFALRQRLSRGIVQLEQRLAYSIYREQYLLDQRGASALDSVEENRDQVAHLSSVLRIEGSARHHTTVGGEHLFEHMEAERLAEPGRRTRSALFAQHEYRPLDGRHRLRFVPGVRFDLDSQFGHQVSPKLAARFDLGEDWVFRGGYGHGFRAPSFQELHLRFENPSVGYAVGGNPHLEAERARGIDLGVEGVLSDAVQVSGTLFRNDLSNMITPVTTPEGQAMTLFTYDNLATARTQGVESTVRIAPLEGVSFLGGYTFTDTWDGEHRRAIPGQARHRVTGSVRVEHRPSRVVFVLRGATSLERKYYASAAEGQPEREIVADALTLVDARVTHTFSRTFELFGGVDNVLDVADPYTIVFPRTYYVGLRGRH